MSADLLVMVSRSHRVEVIEKCAINADVTKNLLLSVEISTKISSMEEVSCNFSNQ